MITRLTFDQISTAVHDAYEACKDIKGGQNAHYIPYLANVNSDLFGISLCLRTAGSSLWATPTTASALNRSRKCTRLFWHWNSTAHRRSSTTSAPMHGLPFNSIFAILLENDRPSTPLGERRRHRKACSLVKPHGDTDGKWKAIFDNMTALLGSEPQLIDELYQSESATNFDNRSITWLLQEYGRMYDDPGDVARPVHAPVLTGRDGRAAGHLGGHHRRRRRESPHEAARVGAELTSKVVALMSAVGFYEHSGDWLYATGLPAKTGVGGAVIGVMPGLFGVCAFAPPLDDAGNSVKAQAALKHLMKSLNLNVFSNTHFDLVEA